jgi:hypothetical protein
MADLHQNQPIPSASGRSSADNTPAGILFASASRIVAAYNSEERYNPNCKGLRMFITNDAAGGGTVTVKIQVKDPIGDTWTDLAGATTAALGAVTGSIITIYPGLTGIADAAGITINQHLGCVWRAVATVAVATVTFSVGAEYLL